MPTAIAYGVDSATSPFTRREIERRALGPFDVQFDNKFAGICHSDIHTARGEWGRVNYPLVPGHELAGVVTGVGEDVTRVEVGDHVGVGCFVDSCGECEYCKEGLEQFCSGDGGTIWTYNATDHEGKPTNGGYSTVMVVNEDYLCRIPESIPLDKAAPLMCAGITLYSPLKKWGAGPGKKVAIVGMGGLGHMGVKIAAAMGADVTVISQTMSKEADGLAFGAKDYYATSDPETFKKLRGTFDLIISTVASSDFNLDGIIQMLRVEGALVDVGLPEHPVTFRISNLTGGNKILAGSQIGGIAETQEMLDFCAEHDVTPQIEVISGEEITDAYDKVVHSMVRYRYVIDTSTF